MKKSLIKVIGVTFVIALVINVIIAESNHPEIPPLFGANTITQTHIS